MQEVIKEGKVTASYSESAGGVGGDSDRRIWPREDNSSGGGKTDMKERCCACHHHHHHHHTPTWKTVMSSWNSSIVLARFCSSMKRYAPIPDTRRWRKEIFQKIF